MAYKFFIPQKDLNDATDFYVGIIGDALRSAGMKVTNTTDAASIGHDDIVLTITVRTFYEAYRKHPKKQIHWFQGITPEEMLMLNLPKWKKELYNIVGKWGECFALKHSNLNFFVSHAMVEHYGRKYGYKGDNYVIMPCFNAQLHKQDIPAAKYDTPTFVYAGNLAKWQCVDKTLNLFGTIKKQMPDAKLYLYTKDIEQGKALLKEHGLDGHVDYVPYNELSKALDKIKYGFIIREDININNVATPTKMSTYMACGIIPIFTDVIGDFKTVFQNMRYAVPLDTEGNGLEKLYRIEREGCRKEDVMRDFSCVFNSYYSPSHYMGIIMHYFKDYGLF